MRADKKTFVLWVSKVITRNLSFRALKDRVAVVVLLFRTANFHI